MKYILTLMLIFISTILCLGQDNGRVVGTATTTASVVSGEVKQDSNDIKDNCISFTKIKSETIGSDEIANGSIKIQDLVQTAYYLTTTAATTVSTTGINTPWVNVISKTAMETGKLYSIVGYFYVATSTAANSPTIQIVGSTDYAINGLLSRTTTTVYPSEITFTKTPMNWLSLNAANTPVFVQFQGIFISNGTDFKVQLSNEIASTTSTISSGAKFVLTKLN